MHHTPRSGGGRELDALLAGYAAGSLPRPLHALIGAHVDLRPSAAGFVSDLELLKGSELDQAEPVALSFRDKVLADIFSIPAAEPVRPAAADNVFPPSLARFLGVSSSDVPWRSVLPGVREWTISHADGVEAKLYWVKAGRAMPSHTHEGQEVTLLLQGGFTDQAGHYRRGDIAVADHDLDHKPIADQDEDCICFAVTDAPLRLTGPIATFFRSLFRH
jgi:putative transcriptional regulator